MKIFPGGIMNLSVRLIMGLSLACASLAIASDVWTKSATLDVVESLYGFEGVTSATLSLSKSEDSESAPYTTVTVDYAAVDGQHTYVLNIDSVEQDEQGCTWYHANLPPQSEDDPLGYHRFTVSLYDKSTCPTAAEGPIWIASVREGYGFCGTMDSTMELQGTPTM